MKKVKSIVMAAVLIILAALAVTACAGNLYLSKTDITLEADASETVVASTKQGGAKAEGVVWSSADAQIATVSDGKITGVSKGATVIKAALGGKSVNVNVKVNDTLGDYKAAQKTALDAYAAEKGQGNYVADKWTEIQNALAAGKTAIESAADTAAVDTAVTSAKAAIDAVAAKAPARIEIGDVSGIITETQPVTTNVYGQAAAFSPADYKYADISLGKGDTEYSNVRFDVSIDTAGAIQLFAQDTSQNWYNVLVTGWGPAEGFPIADATTRLYAVGLKAGTHTVTIKLVDVNNGGSVILTETAEITVVKPFSIEIGDISGAVTETQAVATTGGQAASFDSANYSYADITLHKGEAEYTNVRFQAGTDTPAALQLFARDTNGKWWNVMETGWGPAEGFSVADATTRFFAVGLKAGTHTVTIKLLDVKNAGSVILTETAQITVTGA